MAKAFNHNSQIARSARAALSPLGCTRLGRSRLWMADQRFWVILVEFQASGFSKGSYPNVGAMWLWYPKAYWSFDYGYRVEPFTTFRDSAQFASVAQNLATRAGKKVGELRKRFSSSSKIAQELLTQSGVWPNYHAAVATGLAGDVHLSRHLFRDLLARDATTVWQKELRSTSAKLAEYLPDLARFRSGVLDLIEKSRALHRLKPDPGCLD